MRWILVHSELGLGAMIEITFQRQATNNLANFRSPDHGIAGYATHDSL